MNRRDEISSILTLLFQTHLVVVVVRNQRARADEISSILTLLKRSCR